MMNTHWFWALIAVAVLVAGAGCRRGDASSSGCNCLSDGFCCTACRPGVDPDCADDDGDGDGDPDDDGGTTPPDGSLDCDGDGYCNQACDSDPDCCAADGECNPACTYDADCYGLDCEGDGECNPDCPYGTDPDCEDAADCDSDGFCNPDCSYGTDPDCEGDPGCPPEVPLGGECDPIDQTCCAVGQRCTLAGTSVIEEVCSADSGSGGDGDLCPGGDGECRAGALCVYMGISVCASFCRSSSDCPYGDVCSPLGGAAEGYSTCAPGPTECDPISGSGCSYGETCSLGGDGTSTWTMCVPEGDNGVGSSCGDNLGCVSGAVCLDVSTDRQCLQLCLLSGGYCPSGQSCLEAGDPTYGVCYAG